MPNFVTAVICAFPDQCKGKKKKKVKSWKPPLTTSEFNQNRLTHAHTVLNVSVPRVQTRTPFRGCCHTTCRSDSGHISLALAVTWANSCSFDRADERVYQSVAITRLLSLGNTRAHSYCIIFLRVGPTVEVGSKIDELLIQIWVNMGTENGGEMSFFFVFLIEIKEKKIIIEKKKWWCLDLEGRGPRSCNQHVPMSVVVTWTNGRGWVWPQRHRQRGQPVTVTLALRIESDIELGILLFTNLIFTVGSPVFSYCWVKKCFNC